MISASSAASTGIGSASCWRSSKPFGIGMLQFAPLFGEDTHNTYLNAFMSYGWLGGIAWPAIVVLDPVRRLALLPAGPARGARPSSAIVATYTVVIAEAWIIDIDHWRHVWLLFGVTWGLAIATARLNAQPGAPCDARAIHEAAAVV